ncbi:uncharacterized protein LOC111643000 [Copidosoma floridanum]|uniref:uncharacterized protein LOC111643000 n=1 Tax=Copidosoma floridanum TaxID=29053 RepID=UPI000C6F8A62|nr:uncharacterized protein LOC111643000 [Copidosoma floridanum]
MGPELEPYAYAYLDDIIIVTETFEEHLKWLEHVPKRVREARLTHNRGKSEFCQPEVKYLGVLVNRDGLRPDPAKLKPITAFPAPKNLKQLRRFLGMVSWYRKFLPNYLTVVEPINRLLHADCYVGANFINAFGTVHDPVDRVLVLKGPGTKVPLEVAGVTTTGEVRLAAVGLDEISSTQQEELQTLLDHYVECEAPLGCTTYFL